MRRHVRSWRKQTLQWQALMLGAEPTANLPPWILLGVKITGRHKRAA
jgi:hypothetical protein